MHLFVHAVLSFVFGHIKLIGIAVYTKGEFRQVMIVQPVTTDRSLAGLFI
jgi:hypothetical protein